MRRFRQILKRMFFLPPFLTVLISAPSFAIVIYVLFTQNEGLPAILAYIASTYALIISLTSAPEMIQGLRRAALNDPSTTKRGFDQKKAAVSFAVY